MRFFGPLALLVLTTALAGCGLGAAMESCLDCGQVRLIEPRVVRDIRLYTTTAPEPYRVGDADTATQAVVFHVRVRMDRGGARDFTLSRASLRVGDRVEIRSGEPVALNAAASYRRQ